MKCPSLLSATEQRQRLLFYHTRRWASRFSQQFVAIAHAANLREAGFYHTDAGTHGMFAGQWVLCQSRA